MVCIRCQTFVVFGFQVSADAGEYDLQFHMHHTHAGRFANRIEVNETHCEHDLFRTDFS